MQTLWRSGVSFFVTLGVGKIPFAPGTWGSALGVLLWWLLAPSALVGSVLIVGLFLLSLPMVRSYEQNSHRHDPKEVIIDEVVGVWLTLLALPLTPGVLVAGFLLFRIFDIWKPFPISWVDRNVPGAFGTLCDDVLAGLIARGLLGYLVTLEFSWIQPF